MVLAIKKVNLLDKIKPSSQVMKIFYAIDNNVEEFLLFSTFEVAELCLGPQASVCNWYHSGVLTVENIHDLVSIPQNFKNSFSQKL